jgi:hypothetical protein
VEELRKAVKAAEQNRQAAMRALAEERQRSLELQVKISRQVCMQLKHKQSIVQWVYLVCSESALNLGQTVIIQKSVSSDSAIFLETTGIISHDVG